MDGLYLEMEPGDDPEGLAHERELEDEALRCFPAISGAADEAEREEMLQAAMDVLDGSAADKLQVDLEWLAAGYGPA
jgi:hypothetical protein